MLLSLKSTPYYLLKYLATLITSRKISALQTKVELAGNLSNKKNLAENLAYREVASWKIFLVNK